MAIDPDLERRLAAGLHAELDRQVGPRPLWVMAPDEPLTRPRRWTMASALVAVLVVVALTTVGGVLLVGGPPSPSVTPRVSTVNTTTSVTPAPPTVPAGPFDVLLDGRLMRGDGWRLLAATYRVQGEPPPSAGAAGSIWAVSDPAILPKVWLAIGRDDVPTIDWTREVVVAVDTPVGFGPVCGQVLVDDVAFDAQAKLITIHYENASTLVVVPSTSGSLPSVAPVSCPFGTRSALLVFALDRAHVPTGPIDITAFRSDDPLTPVAQARALLVVPPDPSGVAASPIEDAGFATEAFGWVRMATRLLVTDDGGTTWRDATPAVSMGDGVVAAVSFLDARQGWLIHNDGPAGGGAGAALSVWRTADGGRTWTRTRMPVSSHPAETLGPARVVWIDAEHVVVDFAGGMGNGYADDVYATADGGRTWPVAVSAGAGVMGFPVFADAQYGLIVGGGAGDRLYGTRDGGRTWQRVPLDLPSNAPVPGATPTLVDARFFSPSNGLLLGMFDAPRGRIPIVYRTLDAGRTWTVLEVGVDPVGSCALVSIDAWTCSQSSYAAPAGLPPNAEIHLVDSLHGWARDGSDDPTALYLTSDGGATWRRVLPSH